MPTLHNVTENTKRLLKYGGFLIGILVLLVLLYRGIIFTKDIFFPTPQEPPTVAFGKLPPIVFPKSLPSEGLTFTIDTVSGSLPVFASDSGKTQDRINVYKIYNPEFSLLDLQNAKAIVSAVGFNGKEVSLGDNRYVWSTIESGLEKTIEMNIVNKDFRYASSFRTSNRILSALRLPTPQVAIDTAKRFLNTMSLFPSDIDEAKTKTQLLKIDGTDLVATDRPESAQIVRVSFFQKDINDMPIFYANVPYSSLDFFIGSGTDRTNSDIVQGTFYHQFITDEFATYPLKPVSQAFEELQNGQAYIASNFIKGNQIKIKDVVLGYYASDQMQEFLIPIYVFKGIDDEFYAYVLAIPDEWFENTTSQN